MVELKKDERKITVSDNGKYLFESHQIQEYDKATVDNMIKSWKDQLGQYETFLKNFDNTVESGIKALKEKMEQQKTKVLTDIKFIKEGLNLWENPIKKEGDEGDIGKLQT